VAKKSEKKKNKGTGLAALFCIGAAYLALHSTHTGNNLNSNSDSSSNSASCNFLENLWEINGGSSSSAFMAAEIAMAESDGNQYATDYDTNGTVDRGYWQINSAFGSESTFDADGNAKSAVIISRNGTNWSPWVTFHNGTYAGQCLGII
jgi:Lysozyme like domain